MHTYQRNKAESLWTVGFELPTEKGLRNFRPMADFTSEAEAIDLVSRLNGSSTLDLRDLVNEVHIIGKTMMYLGEHK